MKNVRQIFKKQTAQNEKPVNAKVYAQLVEKKAFELYERKGCQNGCDLDDWLEAERAVEKELIAGK